MISNPTLLLLPGMLADGAFWRAQVHALSDICEPVVIDYGLADSIEAMADIVLAQAPPRFALAGHSMGGRVAQEVVRRAPERVIRLGLFGTDFHGPSQNAAEWNSLVEAARTGGMERAAQALLPRLVAPERLTDKKLVAGVVAMIVRQSTEHLAAQLRAGHTRPDYSALLPNIACPTLICAGDRDAIRSVAVHEEMARRIPVSRLVVIRACGHMIAMERPDELTAAMRVWL
jgi:pimeloyl-ACP methyl ester carboxylesterase